MSASPSTENYNCKQCQDTGWVYVNVPFGDPDFGKAFRCRCQEENIKSEKAAAMVKMCQLPDATEGKTFEAFDAYNDALKEARDAALQLADEQGDIRWLTLIGPRDRGKSHLAVAVCRRWLQRMEPARYFLVPVMLDELRSGYGEDNDYDQKLRFLMNVPLLVLDDLGMQRSTPWADEKLQMIIDHRYFNRLPLMVTTNKPLDELPGDEEHRIGSRLQRESWCKIVVMDAGEYRQEKNTRS